MEDLQIIELLVEFRVTSGTSTITEAGACRQQDDGNSVIFTSALFSDNNCNITHVREYRR